MQRCTTTTNKELDWSSEEVFVDTGEARSHPDVSSFVDVVDFSAGNPRVEHITGTVHLYRDVEDRDDVPGRSCQLCIMSTPPDMGFAELCAFLGSYFERVNEIRLVRKDGESSTRHLVLLQFDSQGSADGFYHEYNDKPFCLLEPELMCHVLYVRDVQYFEATDGGERTVAPQGVTELPSCPVCLERLDGHVSGIVTTVCNHRFHNQCLRQWVDSSCPVCRYCQHPAENPSSCTVCSTSVDLWMCLICGHVGCGRYKGSHAANHFDETGHGYALELESQRIWDYAQDAYVHRLVNNSMQSAHKEEVEDDVGKDVADRSQLMDSAPDDALVKSKVDAITTEFTHIMVSQLETQRAYFEKVVESHHKETEAILESTRAAWACSKASAEAADAAAQRAESKLRQVRHKNQQLDEKLASVREEREFLRQLNETLLSNQKAFSEKLKAAEAREEALQSELAEMKEQVRDLMMFIEARDTIEKTQGGQTNEAVGGTLMPVPEKARRRRNSTKKK